MSGMCDRCRNDAAVPDGDLCRSCLDDEQRVAFTASILHLNDQCRFRHPGCSPAKRCMDCSKDELEGVAA